MALFLAQTDFRLAEWSIHSALYAICFECRVNNKGNESARPYPWLVCRSLDAERTWHATKTSCRNLNTNSQNALADQDSGVLAEYSNA